MYSGKLDFVVSSLVSEKILCKLYLTCCHYIKFFLWALVLPDQKFHDVNVKESEGKLQTGCEEMCKESGTANQPAPSS